MDMNHQHQSAAQEQDEASRSQDSRSNEKTGPFVLPPLPYVENALSPYISAKTLSFHHGAHHASYVKTVNEKVRNTALAEKELAEVVREAARDKDSQSLFNAAAQAWNHDFYWRSMRPRGGGRPGGDLGAGIEERFGSASDFSAAFSNAATGLFGSGWVWLVLDGKRLEIMGTHDAYTPIADGRVPLLTLDVWEHAYYLDHQNRRGEYVDAFLEHLINWDFAAENFAKAREAQRTAQRST